jgi:hypothetical protein
LSEYKKTVGSAVLKPQLLAYAAHLDDFVDKADKLRAQIERERELILDYLDNLE